MIFDLSKIEFVNDMFSTDLPNGDLLVLNKLDEAFAVAGFTKEVKFNRINIEVVKADGSSVPCISVVGMSDDYISITTKYSELEGSILSMDNLDKCFIEAQ